MAHPHEDVERKRERRGRLRRQYKRSFTAFQSRFQNSFSFFGVFLCILAIVLIVYFLVNLIFLSIQWLYCSIFEIVAMMLFAGLHFRWKYSEEKVTRKEIVDRGQSLIDSFSKVLNKKKGDIISLSPGEMVSSRMRCVEPHYKTLILEKGTIFDSIPSPVSSPAMAEVRSALSDGSGRAITPAGTDVEPELCDEYISDTDSSSDDGKIGHGNFNRFLSPWKGSSRSTSPVLKEKDSRGDFSLSRRVFRRRKTEDSRVNVFEESETEEIEDFDATPAKSTIELFEVESGSDDVASDGQMPSNNDICSSDEGESEESISSKGSDESEEGVVLQLEEETKEDKSISHLTRKESSPKTEAGGSLEQNVGFKDVAFTGGEADPTHEATNGASDGATKLQAEIIVEDENYFIHPSQSFQFRLLRTPNIRRLHQLLYHALTSPNMYEGNFQQKMKYFVAICGFILLLTFVTSLARFIAHSVLVGGQWALQYWSMYLVYRQVHVLIPFLGIFSPVLYSLFMYHAHSQVISLFQVLQKINEQEIMEDSIRTFGLKEQIFVQPALVFANWLRILTGRKTFWTRSSKLFQVLGHVSVVCCPDRSLLQNPTPVVKKLLLPSEVPSSYITLEMTRTAAGNSYGYTFADDDWEDYAPRLKPIGLCCILNTICGTKDKMLYREIDEALLKASVRPRHEKCTCNLSLEIGFSMSVRTLFHKMALAYLTSGNEYVKLLVVKDTRSDAYQMLCSGDLSILLKLCREFWTGTELLKLDAEHTKALLDTARKWERSNMTCEGFCYSPISKNDAQRLLESGSSFSVFHVDDYKLSVPLIFIGMIAKQHFPKQDVVEAIEAFNECGIRFVHFSEDNGDVSRIFGNALGLETDWNTLIHLRRTEEDRYNEMDIKAKLPFGIEEIKSHIQNVDNVPLLVQLFCNSRPHEVAEMVKLYVENSEVVCCLGETSNSLIKAVYLESDITLAMDSPSRNCVTDLESQIALVEESSIAFPAALRFHSKTNMFTLLRLIKKAREIQGSIRQIYRFIVYSNLFLALTVGLGYFVSDVPIFNTVQVFFIMTVIIPVLCFGFVSIPAEAKVMRLMPDHTVPNHLKSTLEIVLKLTPQIIIVLVFFHAVLNIFVDMFAYESFLSMRLSLVYLGVDSRCTYGIHLAQNVTMIVWVVYLICATPSFFHNYKSLRSFHPFLSSYWLTAVVISALFQATFTISAFLFDSIIHTPSLNFLDHSIPFYFEYYYVPLLLSVLVYPVINVIVEEILKTRKRKKFIMFQKRSRLQFDTRLGMYSPR